MIRDDVVGKINDPRLVAISVFIPMLSGDSVDAARDSAGKLKKVGIDSFWDGKRDLGKEFGEAVMLPRGLKVAWDAYFIFGPDAKWQDRAPKPVFWMHQLANDDRFLDGDKFREQTEAELKKLAALAIDRGIDSCRINPALRLFQVPSDHDIRSGAEVVAAVTFHLHGRGRAGADAIVHRL